MTNPLFEGKETIIKETIRLANEIALAEEKHSQDELFYSSDELQSHPAVKEKEKALDEFLDTLKYEDIQLLQTIMYLGRDNEHQEGETPEEIYQQKFDSLLWNENKHIEVNQMTGKQQLGDYLTNGAKLLNITL